MKTVLTSLTSLCIAVAVMLSGAYAKELSGMQYVRDPNKKTAATEDHGYKISHDVHTHVDKQVLKTALQTSSKYQTDARSLRLMQHRHSTLFVELSLRLQSLFKQYLRVSYA